MYLLYQRKDNSWDTFLSVIKDLPENDIKEISFVKTTLNDVILVEKEENGNSFANVDAARLSDGTLRSIAVLAAVMSEPEYSIVAIEELDNGIHPSRAKNLMNALTKIAR